MSRLREEFIENILSRLPEEIIENILSWLPVKSIKRFRFNLLITILGTDQNTPTLPDMFSIDHNVISSSSSPSQSLSSPFLGNAVGIGYPFTSSTPRTFGSCNGLVCIKPWREDNTIYIWNRCTKEYKEVPETPIKYPPALSRAGLYPGTRTLYGFGFDCKADDYKMLRIVGFEGEYVSEARVYSLGLNSWKSLGFIPYSTYWYRDRGLLVDGVLHWIAVQCSGYEAPRSVVSFDISDETFRYTPFPYYCFAYNALSFLGIWEGKLCLILQDDKDNDAVWTMKDYTWTKHLNIPRHIGLTYGRAIQTFQNGEVLLDYVYSWKEKSEESGSLISYDPKHGRVKVLKLGSLPDLIGIEPYIETLVSPYLGTFVGQQQIKEEGSSRWRATTNRGRRKFNTAFLNCEAGKFGSRKKREIM
ncbi:F-box protein At3g07870-like [Papaver somniferum]|uniref:F-box protein At3g07870-like n=1 Tax=Papaver somniferum TaxID=3469 RepID=UPI000E6FB290|nr:F-box protein At3g07870-like [Papaver somniferum]